MDLLHFDHRVAGAKTLWIIRFDPYDDNKKHFDLLLPSPLEKDGWLVISNSSPEGLLKSFDHFQQMCESVKLECQQHIDKLASSPQGNKDISLELEKFTKLIRYFNEIMKHFKKPTSEHNPDT